MIESGNQLMTGLMALGVAWLFIRTDSQSATSRALSLALALTGVGILIRFWLIEWSNLQPLPWWSGLLVIPGAGSFYAGFEWTHRVRLTLPAGDLKTSFGDKAIRLAQALSLVYALAAILYPSLWINEFLPGLDGRTPWSTPVIALFAAPLGIAMVLWAMATVLCLNRRPDDAERARLIAFLAAGPLMAAGLVLPLDVAPLATTLSFFMLLAGAMRHAQLIGRRGQFMSRFLSPQVAQLVNRQGLQAAMRESYLTLTVVCVDLRGFTAFSEANQSEQVLAVLRRYYDAVGVATQAAEGTIKDYAGDGVLILVGAPVALSDHGERGLELALAIGQAVREITDSCAHLSPPLGVGIGVASGAVTVGVIGGEGRLEYAAVGPAVNLASRLCDQANDGEIVLSEETVRLVNAAQCTQTFAARAPQALKGFDGLVASFALET